MATNDHHQSVFMTEKQAARLLSLSHRTLQAWRRTGSGPSFIKFGRAIRYRQQDILGWAGCRAHTHASSAIQGLAK